MSYNISQNMTSNIHRFLDVLEKVVSQRRAKLKQFGLYLHKYELFFLEYHPTKYCNFFPETPCIDIHTFLFR